MVRAKGMPSHLLQTAGHIVTQVASQLDRIAFGNQGSTFLTSISSLLDVSCKLVPGPVSVSLAVQGKVSPQRGGVATELTVAATGNQGAPLRLGQRARGVQVLLHRL